MAQQNVEFNIGANVTGMEAIATLINRVGALEAETKKLASANAALSSSTDAVIKNGTRYNNALDAQSKELRNARQGTQQLGMQINDFATSVSTGASPIQAFNQQLGQVGYAMSLMGGTAGKVGAFLAGPWGAAITIATMALGGMISKLFETSEETKKLEKASADLDSAIEARKDSEDSLRLALAKTAGEYRKIRAEMQANALMAVNSAKVELNARLKVLTGLMAEQSRLEQEVRGAGGMRAQTEMGTGQVIDRYFNSRETAKAITSVRAQTAELEGLTAKLNAATVDVVQAAKAADRAGGKKGGDGSNAATRAAEAAAKKEQEIANSLAQHKIRAEISWQKTWEDLQDKQVAKSIERSSQLQEQLRVQAEMNRTLFIEPVNAGLQELAQSYANIGNTVAGAFKGMLTGATSWKDGMKGIINSVIDELWRLYVVQQIVGLIGNALGGIGLPIPNIAGKRANGGHVSGNRPYLVGENGPELMVPGGSGTIIPNRNLGMGATGGSGMTINVDARGANDPAAVRAQVQQGILEAAPAIIAAAEARTVQGMRRPRLGGAMQ